MKLLKLSAMGAFFCSLFILPNLVIDDVSLGAEEAIRGHDFYQTISSNRFGNSQSEFSISGYPPYRYDRKRERYSANNVLRVRALKSGVDGYPGGYIDLDDLTLNQALPDPPNVNLNISQSSDSKKALVRWNID